MAAVLPTSAERTKKGCFCRAKAFIRTSNAADRLTASWFAIKKQESERNVFDPEVCSGFSLRGCRVVELLKFLAEALDYGDCEACATALRLSNCINEPVSGLRSLLYICMLFKLRQWIERRILLEQIRPTVAPGRCEVDQSLVQMQSLLLNSHFAMCRNQTSEHMKNRNQ